VSIILSKSVFLAAPKTGSSWIEKSLMLDYKMDVFKRYKDNGFYQDGIITRKKEERVDKTKHVPYFLFENGQPTECYEAFKGKKAFVFVRHPLTWYQSVFSFWFQKANPKKHRTYKHKLSGEKHIQALCMNRFYYQCFRPNWDNFDKFIDAVIDYANILEHGYWSTISSMFTVGCSEIGKFESLVDDLCKILNKLEEKYTETIYRERSKKKVNCSKSHERKYTRERADKIMEIEHQYIKRFDYEYVLDKWIR
jgi:hypothetical protein